MSATDVAPTVLQFIADNHRLLIGGDWVDAQEGGEIDVLDPATGELLTRVAEARAGDVDAAVHAARRAFDDGPWRGLSTSARGNILLRAATLVEERGQELAQLDSLDAGLPIGTSQALVAFCVDFLRYMAGLPTKIEGSTLSPAAHSPDRFLSQILREPLGVIGQISPWNAPLTMAIEKVAPALATGNCIVLKPAEQTPLTALALGQILLDAGLPAGVLNVVPGRGETAGAALVEHGGVDKISFTGSTEVGKRIVAAVAPNLTKVSLELGGKSPNIVFADAYMDEAVQGAASAIFAFSGQSCAAGSRLFVEQSVFDDFLSALAQEAKRLTVANPLDPATDLGPLVSGEQRERVLGYLRSGREAGGCIVTGGEPLDRPGFFMAPTIVSNTDPGMAIEREEIFGPVVTAIPFKDQDEVVARANATTYGLAAGVWTSDIKRAHQVTRALRAGVVWVNCYNMFDSALPFGGYKHSGWGRENGLAVIDLYTQTKTVTTAF
jgi:phenylacetaldehyde dehydrogenase